MEKYNFFKNITKNKVLLFLNIVFIIIILILSIILISKSFPSVNFSKITRDQDNNFKFTNPILDCEDINQSENTYISFEKINKEVDSLKDKYNVKDASLYFRDLNNGPWVGVNEQIIFSPASLLKVPVVMALFKYAEQYPEILRKEFMITESNVQADLNQNITFPDILKKDNKYTILQIVESMIKKSDNAGVGIVINSIPSDYISAVFNSVGVPYKDVDHEVSLSVKDYSGFFRVLFNSSYLSREMSEKILNILSQSEYKDGLVAGIPDGITVAHKFGERSGNNIYQLHDCGIIYYPNNPYILCVMTLGNSFKNQESLIQDISSYIYTEIDKEKKNQ